MEREVILFIETEEGTQIVDRSSDPELIQLVEDFLIAEIGGDPH